MEDGEVGDDDDSSKPAAPATDPLSQDGSGVGLAVSLRLFVRSRGAATGWPATWTDTPGWGPSSCMRQCVMDGPR